jgi:hypothetical protein
MNLDRFNLNLFVAFEALSKADTLTQAAGALYVTQSTLSVALRQMREYFDDELFVYKPKQKELTPLAQNLRPRVLEILRTAKATLMLKEEAARFGRRRCMTLDSDESPADLTGRSRATKEMSDLAAYVQPESRAVDRRDWFKDDAESYSESQSHIQRRALKSRLLVELD